MVKDMKLAVKLVLVIGEILLTGAMLYLFTEVMDWISPNFVIDHYTAYLLGAFIWSALPAIALIGIILRYMRKDEPPTYTGGYY